MKVLPNYFKLLSFPIYYLIHNNYLFGFLQKKIFKKFSYKNYNFKVDKLKLPTSYHSSFFWKTYELNDRVIIEKNLNYKNKCIIIGGGIGFIGTLSYHLSKNKIVLFEINKQIINLLKKNLIENLVKFKLYNYNLTLNKSFKNNIYFENENFLSNSIYRKSKSKNLFKNLYYKKIKDFGSYNTLIIDGEGIEEHYIYNLNKIKNIKYIFFELHYDILNKARRNKIFKYLKQNNFILKDKFVNSFFFERMKQK